MEGEGDRPSPYEAAKRPSPTSEASPTSRDARES
jgi:hypothetical protein